MEFLAQWRIQAPDFFWRGYTGCGGQHSRGIWQRKIPRTEFIVFANFLVMCLSRGGSRV